MFHVRLVQVQVEGKKKMGSYEVKGSSLTRWH